MAARRVTAGVRGLPPILPRDARILVLGSFPGVASLAARQYYAHPRNHFWPVMAVLLDEPLVEMPYAERLKRMRARGVALWDTIVACEREGSSDQAIRRAERAEVPRVRRASPRVEVVAFNGNTAARAAPRWSGAGFATLALPSTSPAYTKPFAEKLAAWRALDRWIATPPSIEIEPPTKE
ncbi:MAG: DNA-deoxyinosine glycosylase [Betaproteobacteria bacterium]